MADLTCRPKEQCQRVPQETAPEVTGAVPDDTPTTTGAPVEAASEVGAITRIAPFEATAYRCGPTVWEPIVAVASYRITLNSRQLTEAARCLRVRSRDTSA